ncbi:DUF6114 domain-containing protein [Streptacidiphilus jiangxiensis]|uniref:Integral membrane protein n=1 Tax=Streptacidiphilus jiangxiensis TaxID=235985 RepID=A0A1H7GA67_STRJI|nr:DUF6114 domain-containing protein [Streptacidiphilus jiangxiensis]SEK35163.1 hypothetical protein SAMN05414137_101614 [Streptacidiphilus jiangxiensis]
MTSAMTTAQPDPISGFTKARRAFRDWRRTRPFWGGLLILCAAGPILYFPYATMNIGALRIQMATTAGAGSAVIGMLLIALGISCWFQPLIRVFAGIAAIVLSIISLPVSNFGGFGMGLLFGILGGALVCSWAPLKAEPEVAAAVTATDSAEAAQAAQADTQVVLPTQQAGEAGPAAEQSAAQPAAAPEAQQPQEPQEESKSVE